MFELILLATIVAYYFLRLKYQYWKKRGIAGPKPTFLVGNLGKSYALRALPGQIYADIYNAYPDEQVVGIYRATTPVLLIRDPEFIKDILIKSFKNFQDNDVYIDKKKNPILGRNIFLLKGEQWKSVRSKLSPAFTSGKMKWLYPLLEDVCQELVKFIADNPDMTNGKGYNAKELCVRYTLNNVGSCAFGVEGKCFVEEDSEFRQLARGFLEPGGWSMFMAFLGLLCPSFTKLIPIRVIPKKIDDKLIEIVSQTLKYREANKVVRNDFLHVMSQLRETSKDLVFTDTDIAAQAAGFFADGAETSSGVMSFILFSLASTAESQNKLREEVSAAFAAGNGKLSYEALQALPFLEAVIYETLRMYPAVPNQQKVCTEPFTFTPKNSKQPVTIEQGTPIILPVLGLHKDPKYFQNPESFKPDRFLGDNKENVTKGAFLPFGEGPRICIGQRFAMLQIKAGVAHVIQNYHLSVNKRTQVPLKFLPNTLLMAPVGGIWLDFKKID